MAIQIDDTVAMSTVGTIRPSPSTQGEQVFLNEEHARIELCKHEGDTGAAWYLDTDASNHMTGDATVFAELK